MASAPEQAPRSFDELATLLQERFSKLSPAHRLLAGRVMADAEGVAFMTISELASEVGVNEATVVRFANGLGLEGYPGLTRLCRERLREQAQLVRRYDQLQQMGGEGGNLLEKSLLQDRTNISRTLARVDQETWAAAVQALSEAPRVHVMGLRKCYAPAYLLGYLLRMLREDVEVVTGNVGTLTDELRRVGPGDCFTAISIHRYTAQTVRAFEWARERGARCVALTDNPASPLARIAHHAFYVEASGPSVLRSLTAFTALVQALGAGVAEARGHEARSTLLREEELLDGFGVYTTDGAGPAPADAKAGPRPSDASGQGAERVAQVREG
ncbi:MAG TPA: MurR/RpiR family transcriptional regulator [Actinospica sp.]|nr:MurR/RpiR family transcriptional regulator [Actinospica sp.]